MSDKIFFMIIICRVFYNKYCFRSVRIRMFLHSCLGQVWWLASNRYLWLFLRIICTRCFVFLMKYTFRHRLKNLLINSCLDLDFALLLRIFHFWDGWPKEENHRIWRQWTSLCWGLNRLPYALRVLEITYRWVSYQWNQQALASW